MSHEIPLVEIKHIAYAPGESPLPRGWTSINLAIELIHATFALWKSHGWGVSSPIAFIHHFPCGCVKIQMQGERRSTMHDDHFICDTHFGSKMRRVYKKAWLPYMVGMATPELIRLLPKLRLFM